MKTKYLLAILALTVATITSATRDRPNVVLIVCDDLNDYITGIQGETGHPQTITPNVEAFAKTGVAFRRAYSNNPVCAPSRNSFMTGTYGHSWEAGNIWPNRYKWGTEEIQNCKSISEYFRDNGYHAVGSGKLFHYPEPDGWTRFHKKADYGPFAYDGHENVAHTSVPAPFNKIGPVDGSYGPLETLSYINDGDPETGWVKHTSGDKKQYLNFSAEGQRSLTPDEANAKWAADMIRKHAEGENDKPLFLAVGFIRPHTPLHVSRKYFDMFPLGEVKVPVTQENDNEDTYLKEYIPADPTKEKGHRYFKALLESYDGDKELALKKFTQAYLACVAAVDECIGEVIKAVDESPMKDNTIIVLTSDHGYNMGEKDYLFKASPWEESTRVPFIIRAPGVTPAGKIAEHPISLIDLYPTLKDLCGLTADTRKSDKGLPLDGFSVRPFLENPKADTWNGPDGALSTVKGEHWTLRTKRWRYIQYKNGEEELYDHDQDPNEWTNLAGDPSLQSVKEELHQAMLEMRSGKR